MYALHSYGCLTLQYVSYGERLHVSMSDTQRTKALYATDLYHPLGTIQDQLQFGVFSGSLKLCLTDVQSLMSNPEFNLCVSIEKLYTSTN